MSVPPLERASLKEYYIPVEQNKETIIKVTFMIYPDN